MVQQIDAENFTTTIQYDAIGRRTAMIDASGNTTTFAYDKRDLLTRETDAAGNAMTMAYDAAGQLTSRIDRLGRRRDFTYDAASRVLTEKWYTAGSLQQTQTYTYDSDGNLLTGADPDGTISFTYDALDRVTREAGLFGQVLTSSYDAVGNRTERRDALGGIETYTYDAVNKLTSQRATRNGTEPTRIETTYTDRNQVDTISRYTDLTATTLRGSSDFTYDDLGRETHFVHQDGSSTTLSEGTYTYDAASRLTEQALDGNSTTYYPGGQVAYNNMGSPIAPKEV